MDPFFHCWSPEEVRTPMSGHDASLHAMLQRALKLDPNASTRVRHVPAINHTNNAHTNNANNNNAANQNQSAEPAASYNEVFVTTPFSVIAGRRTTAKLPEGTFTAASLLADTPVLSGNWPGALPPVGDWSELERIPAGEALRLVQQGQDLARQFSSSLGPPASLLSSPVIEAEGWQIPMRVIFALSSMGFLPPAYATGDFPREIRLATSGRWLRVDAPFGSVYLHKGGLSLFVS